MKKGKPPTLPKHRGSIICYAANQFNYANKTTITIETIISKSSEQVTISDLFIPMLYSLLPFLNCIGGSSTASKIHRIIQ